MEEETHSRLPTNNSTTKNNATPSVPQSNQVHGTSQQNQCAKYSAGQDILVSTMEQTSGNQTPTTGTDGYIPHRDEGTQMPSKEIHISTREQSTQMPSQQRDPATTTGGDLENKQIKDNTPATTVQKTSPGPGIHQGTYPHSPPHRKRRSTTQLNRVKQDTLTRNP